MIELDLLAPAADADESTPWSAASRRRILLFLAFALVLLTMTGAAAPAEPGLVRVRTATLVNSSTYRILGDTLYVAEVLPDGNRITAYPLAERPPRWSTGIDVLAGNAVIEEVAGMVVVGMFQPGVTGDHVAALDRRTGVLRWHSSLNLVAVDRVRSRLVLTGYPTSSVGSGPPPADVVAVDARTGMRVWTYRREAGCQGDLPDQVTDRRTGLAVLCSDGQLLLLDLDTGQVRARAPTGATGQSGARVTALSDRVLVSLPAAGRSVLVSYELDRLQPTWTRMVELGGFFVSACGPRICLGSSGAALALEPSTGLVRWRVGPVGFATPLVDRYILVAPARLGTVELVDVGTGKVVMNLAEWTTESAPAGPPMFFRADGATGRTWVARLSRRPVGVRVLGYVPNARPETCESSVGYLVCRTVRDTVVVWRYAVD